MNDFFMRAEDDNDFMPIIPITEGESDQDKNAVYPTEIPVLPLRNTVLFPGVVIPITVGRDKSIKAVNDAWKADKLVAVLSQKDSNIEDPEAGDLVEIGTVARIIKLIKKFVQSKMKSKLSNLRKSL
jgi:ATP-dependent Lon protease